MSSWLLPDVKLPVGKLRTVRPLDMRGAGGEPSEQPKTAAEQAPDRAPEPVTTPSPARPAASPEESNVELRTQVEEALRAHGPMGVKEMRGHVKCSWLAKLCSNLVKHHVILKVAGGNRSGIYALPGQKYDGLEAGAELGRKTKPAAKPQKAVKKERSPAAEPVRQARAPAEGDAQFAINETGELGIEKGDGKLRLDGHEFERLRAFIERTQSVWKVALAR